MQAYTLIRDSLQFPVCRPWLLTTFKLVLVLRLLSLSRSLLTKDTKTHLFCCSFILSIFSSNPSSKSSTLKFKTSMSAKQRKTSKVSHTDLHSTAAVAVTSEIEGILVTFGKVFALIADFMNNYVIFLFLQSFFIRTLSLGREIHPAFVRGSAAI